MSTFAHEIEAVSWCAGGERVFKTYPRINGCSSKCKVPIHTSDAQVIHTPDPYACEEIEII